MAAAGFGAVLHVGIIIITTKDGTETKIDHQLDPIKDAKELPKERVELTGIELSENDRGTDKGLACLQNCKHLTSLHLQGPGKVTDAGLAHFADCRDLAFLRIFHNEAITDAGIAHLKTKNPALLRVPGYQTDLRVPSIPSVAWQLKPFPPRNGKSQLE